MIYFDKKQPCDLKANNIFLSQICCTFAPGRKGRALPQNFSAEQRMARRKKRPCNDPCYSEHGVPFVEKKKLVHFSKQVKQTA